MEYLISIYLADLSTPNHSTFHTIQGPVRLVCCENIRSPLKLFNCNDLLVTPFKIYNMDCEPGKFACEMWNPRH